MTAFNVTKKNNKNNDNMKIAKLDSRGFYRNENTTNIKIEQFYLKKAPIKI